MRRRRRLVLLLVPLPVILLLCLLEALDVVRYVGDRFYDLTLRMERPPVVARELLLIDIDDRAISSIGAWPWSRDVLADGLLAMKEMDAQYVVFDMLFAGHAPLGVDRRVLRDELPDALEAEYTRISENLRALFDAIRQGSIRASDAPRYVAELVNLVDASKARMLDAVSRVERDNDLYLGQALRFFERSWVATELDSSRAARVPSLEEIDPVAHFALGNVALAGLAPLGGRGLVLPSPHVAQGARGGGFREIDPDPDGVVRRVRPLASYRGRAVGQASFAAALDRLGMPRVSVASDSMELTAEDASPGAESFSIPLTAEGMVLIDWPHPRSGVAPRRLSWNDLHRLGQLEGDLVAMYREMDRAGYLSYFRADPSILDRYRAAESLREQILADGATSRLPDWRQAREAYNALADALLAGDVVQRIVADAERLIASAVATEEERSGATRTRERSRELFGDASGIHAELVKLRANLREALSGSFCIVSVTGASATVSGSTPLGAPSTSGQASAALVNAILTRQFFRSLPRWYSVGLAALLGLLVALLAPRARPRVSVILGAAVALLPCAAAAILLVFYRVVGDPTAPAACALLVGVLVAAVKRRQERADRESWSS